MMSVKREQRRNVQRCQICGHLCHLEELTRVSYEAMWGTRVGEALACGWCLRYMTRTVTVDGTAYDLVLRAP